ncbi:MAG TPA: type II secretion system secretin GspD [Casimicrobiaceae bacterium]|jgi:general secretion pathway protein D|nr:type II secretion system secretin GspD [Casimicrobiaceae bacterium]
MPKIPFARHVLATAVALALAACATDRTYAPADATLKKSPESLATDKGLGTGPSSSDERLRTYKGTGVLLRGQLPGGALPPSSITTVTGGNVVLNFEGADVRDVVRNVMGEILNQNYTIDPNVGGTVTLRTSSGIPRESLPATLETVLRMAGATMVKEGDLYKVVPMAAAVRGNLSPQLGNSQRALPQGYSVQVVPLHWISAPEMVKILEPFAKDAQAIRADSLRNLLILAGTERELRHLLDTIDMFDVNWMAGMSVGLFTLQNADVKSVMSELDKAIGDKAGGPLASIFKIIPIERMNAILVVSPNAQYVEEAKQWIDRLDRGGGGDAPRFYVYNLENTRAEHVGPLLQQAFTGRQSTTTGPAAPTVAPGTPAGSIVSPPTFSAQPAIQTPPPPQVTVNNQPPGPGTQGGAGTNVGVVRNLQVVADKDNNAILIVATPAEYQVIEAALRKLDVPSRQIVMEMAIVEVTLTDEFQAGVDWVFKGGAPSGRGYGGNVAQPNPAANSAALVGSAISGALSGGFSYLIGNGLGGIQAAIRLLDTYGNVKVVSNPHIAALDNQKATIKVGDRIPINQQSIVGSTTNVVTTTASYIDTGVLVQVTPHINAGGLVTLDVQAEVSNPGNPAVAGDAPPISTRSVQTLVAVPSGETMVMGGLITETKSNSTSGLPLVNRIPIFGALFGNQDLKNNRTELVLFVTPRVVENMNDINTVINDLRRRMDNIDELFPGGSRSGRIYPAGTTTMPALRSGVPADHVVPPLDPSKPVNSPPASGSVVPPPDPSKPVDAPPAPAGAVPPEHVVPPLDPSKPVNSPPASGNAVQGLPGSQPAGN